MLRRHALWVPLLSIVVLPACSGGPDDGSATNTGSTQTLDAGANPSPEAGAFLDSGALGQRDSTTEEVCDNGLDDDGDGAVDEDCSCAPGDTRPCYGGDPAHAGEGICNLGEQVCEQQEGTSEFKIGAWGACEGFTLPQDETCDSVDNDCDGEVDEDLDEECSTECGAGTQTCADGTWSACDAPTPEPEVCNGVDDNCNGEIDEGLIQGCDAGCGAGTQECVSGAWSSCEQVVVDQALDLDGDCVWAQCPSSTPYPIGCQINFVGGDARGCVAYVPGETKVYFQEGDKCNAGHLSGTLLCSSCPGGGLNANNCPINKPEPYYVQNYKSCPGDQP